MGLALPAAAIAALVGCAPAAPPGPAVGVPADIVVAGRFESSEELSLFHPIGGGELSHVAEAWRLLAFRPSGQGSAPIRFAGWSSTCPPDPLDSRTYVVALRRTEISRLEVRSRGKLIGPPSGVIATLEMTACAPIDEASSAGFIRP